jgi:hypothetical protein
MCFGIYVLLVFVQSVSYFGIDHLSVLAHEEPSRCDVLLYSVREVAPASFPFVCVFHYPLSIVFRFKLLAPEFYI